MIDLRSAVLTSQVLTIVFLARLFVVAADSVSGEATDTTLHGSDGLLAEARLIRYLIHKLPSLEGATKNRPVEGAGEPVVVSFGITLIHILDFHQKQQKLTTQMWQTMNWRDIHLKWDPAEFDGIETLSLNKCLLWTPDIVLYNMYGQPKSNMDEAHVSIHHTGEVIWVPLAIYDSSCQVDLTDFPFDTQICELKFGSWAHSVAQLDMVVENDFSDIDLDSYIPNVEWSLIKTNISKGNIKYKCCPDRYTLVTYSFQLRRNSGYYVRVMLLPIIILSILSIFIFCIPAQRPDRTSIGLSLFTSFMLLLLLVVDTSPPSASSKLSVYLTACIGIVASTIVISIVLIHISVWKGKVPLCIKHIFLKHLARILFPVTFSQSKNGQQLPNFNVPEWVQFVMVMDRIMFIIFTLFLSTCIIVFFPVPP